MKLTKSQLKQIIKEELKKALTETDSDIAIHKGQGPDVSPSGPSPVEKIIAHYADQSQDHGDVITRALNAFLEYKAAEKELDDYGKQLISTALQDPKLQR